MKKHLVSVCCLAGVLLAMSCSSKPKAPDVSSGKPPLEASDLTLEAAKSRKSRLSNVQYFLNVILNETDPTFHGTEKVVFDLNNAKENLRLDFLEGQTSRMRLNGKDLPAAAKQNAWIELPAEDLQVGTNQFEIDYSTAYSRQGTGLHRFQDPETKDIFLYTHFEPFDAHRAFPCFDQPDLRSIMHLTVQAPTKWQVISTTLETEVKDLNPQTKAWTFAATPPLATYLFSLHAGPYQVWTDQYEDIPLRLFARPSLAKYIPAKEWMTLTKQGLGFYNGYFGLKYPFKKYDQIVVPESNSGAMENVGAVTFTENYLKRGERTREERRRLANTLLHEMAHMWFGDLVTMAWWNDLWLNESFATFMSTQALVNATEFKEAWQVFFNDDKTWAYWEDSLITTHPIEAQVNSVRQAFANFDGITYGKGASVLEQLRFYIGEKAFQDGIQAYIKSHAYQNTELPDFMASLQLQTKKDLNLWAKTWLQQSGTDSLAVNWTCEGSRLHKIEVNLTPDEGTQFRPQALEIGLLDQEKSTAKNLAKTFQILRADLESTHTEITGDWKCPAFVYPNIHDYGYAKVILDPVSLNFAKKNLMNVADPMLRNMVWNDLWQMVRAGKMPLKDYVQIVNAHFAKETDILSLELVRNSVSGRHLERGSLLEFWPRATPAEEKAYVAFIEKMEANYLKRFHQAKAGSDEQKLWFDSFVNLARTKTAMNQLKNWLPESTKIAPGFKLDLDRRWNVLHQLVRFDGDHWASKVTDFKTADSSDRGVRQALAINAVQAQRENKEKWFDSLTKEKTSLSLWEAVTVMGALFPMEQDKLAADFDARFYSYVSKNAKGDNDVYLHLFANSLAPLSCDANRSEKLKTFLAQQSLLPTVTKSLKVRLQEDERCQMVRSKSEL